MSKHILSVLVENHAGVLSRVAGLFSRRGFNIESLTVGTTENEKISRMTIVVDGDEYLVDQVTKQLNKLIDVIKIKSLSQKEFVSRQLVLIKVWANDTTRGEIMQIVNIFRAKIIDISTKTLTIEMTGSNEKILAIMEMLEKYGICEMVQTGTVSIERGENNINK